MANDTAPDTNLIERRSVLRLVESVLQRLQLEVKSGSCADFTRLLQLQRELRREEDAENVRKIEVTWVDPVPETEYCIEK
jgi:hypothetical protein